MTHKPLWGLCPWISTEACPRPQQRPGVFGERGVIRLVFLAFLMLAVVVGPATAQTRQLTDDQIQAIQYHYEMDKYFVGGCLIGATFGAITGLMTLSGVSVIAAVPYISTGCSVGFLIGGVSMVVGDFLLTSLHDRQNKNIFSLSAPAN